MIAANKERKIFWGGKNNPIKIKSAKIKKKKERKKKSQSSKL